MLKFVITQIEEARGNAISFGPYESRADAAEHVEEMIRSAIICEEGECPEDVYEYDGDSIGDLEDVSQYCTLKWIVTALLSPV